MPEKSESFVFGLPAVKNLVRRAELIFDRKVTFFVGENGTENHTLLEAIAVASASRRGRDEKFQFCHAGNTFDLHRYLTVLKGNPAAQRRIFPAGRELLQCRQPKSSGSTRSTGAGRFSNPTEAGRCTSSRTGKAFSRSS